MNMVYYKNPQTEAVFGYDSSDPTQVPLIEQAISDGWEDVTGSWPPPPSDEDKKEQCKSLAKAKISAVDWAVLPDVALVNKTEFETYRADLRSLILNPVVDPVWPTEPQPIWE